MQRNLANDRAQTARSQAARRAGNEAALESAPADALADRPCDGDAKETDEARVALRRAILANPVAYARGSDAETATRQGARADALAFRADGGSVLVALGPDRVLRVRR